MGYYGFTVMVGETSGDWSGAGAGDADFMAIILRASDDGITEHWRWQVGYRLKLR